jgi:hypothetical protein
MDTPTGEQVTGLAPVQVVDPAPAVIATEINNAQEEVPTEDVVFRPTREQRKAKAMFYATAKARRVDLKPGITMDLAQELLPTSRYIKTWWHNDLFVEWFTNSTSYQQRIDYLIDLQLDNLEDVVVNREGIYTARDQVAAGKQLAEYKKAFIEEDKAERPDVGVDVIKALAAKMLAEKRKQLAGKVTDAEVVPDDVPERRVELPYD